MPKESRKDDGWVLLSWGVVDVVMSAVFIVLSGIVCCEGRRLANRRCQWAISAIASCL